MKVWQGRVRLGVKKRFCIQRVVRHWDRLLRDVVIALSLREFKKHLDNTSRQRAWIWVVWCGTRSWIQ